eukprot:TRINITY_DN18497_c0_g1_i5.p1 TRINITY_DN18497_c0_g1~~TRINITY_DN18497_c0_g1_i5.p1  ORF type:complete len:527 (+),score=44.26 TRINITY_DN18497_c0_g1_i5:224-1582(+)
MPTRWFKPAIVSFVLSKALRWFALLRGATDSRSSVAMGGGKKGRGGKGQQWSSWGPGKSYVSRSWGAYDGDWNQNWSPNNNGFDHGSGFGPRDPLAAAAANVETALATAAQVHNVSRLGGVLSQVVQGAPMFGSPGCNGGSNIAIPGNTSGMSAALLNAMSGNGALSGGEGGPGLPSPSTASGAPCVPAASGSLTSDDFSKLLNENAAFREISSKVGTIDSRMSCVENAVLKQQSDLKEIKSGQDSLSGGLNELLMMIRSGSNALPTLNTAGLVGVGPKGQGHGNGGTVAPGGGAAVPGGCLGAPVAVGPVTTGTALRGPVLPVASQAAAAAAAPTRVAAPPPALPAGSVAVASVDGTPMVDLEAHHAFCDRWNISRDRRDIQFQEFVDSNDLGLVDIGEYWQKMMKCKTLDSWKARMKEMLPEEVEHKIVECNDLKGAFDVIVLHGWPEKA